MCSDDRICGFSFGVHQALVEHNPLCSVDWSKRVHVVDLYYQLVCASEHLSLAARVWMVYRGTDLAVSSIMRQYRGCVLAP